MKLLGIDYGDVRIGLAVSDDLGWTAQGALVLKRSAPEKDLERIGQFIRERGVERIVLGWPRNMNGTSGPRAQLSEQFAEQLRARFALPVELWDERLSTMAAERVLLEADVSRKKRKQVVDQMAAAIILQNYMDVMQTRRKSDD